MLPRRDGLQVLKVLRGSGSCAWVLWMLLPQTQVDAVLAALRAQVDGRNVRWWLEPVLAMGKLG